MPALLVAVDTVVVKVPDLDSGLNVYRDCFGHEVVWRTDRMVGLRMAGTETELVLSLDLGPETDLLVVSVDEAVRAFVKAGGSVVAGPGEHPRRPRSRRARLVRERADARRSQQGPVCRRVWVPDGYELASGPLAGTARVGQAVS